MRPPQGWPWFFKRTAMYTALYSVGMAAAILAAQGCGSKKADPTSGVVVGKRETGPDVMIVGQSTIVVPGDLQIRVCPEEGEPFYVNVTKEVYDQAKPGMKWKKEEGK